VSRTARHRADPLKAGGVHYTPPALASFLAERLVRQLPAGPSPLAVLDPACGDGELLLAFVLALPMEVRATTTVVGYDLDSSAAEKARTRLSALGLARVDVRVADFLEASPTNGGGLFPGSAPQYDVVISNPPYVRTQTLGAARSRELAAQFGISGRVDLFHCFVAGMTGALRAGGLLGLLTSNRFLMIQSGEAMRTILATQYAIEELYDLGDTKLFEAAVLPAIVVARRGPASKTAARFSRVYEARGSSTVQAEQGDVLSFLHEQRSGFVATDSGTFQVEVGELGCADPSRAWTVASDSSRSWMATVEAHQCTSFGEVAQIRVGIKTTADSVFIRQDWDQVPEDQRPEAALLRPLVTHHDDVRWRLKADTRLGTHVLYPHEQPEGERKRAVRLDSYPKARAYLESHRARLESRTYVIEAGRAWYEIWVPQSPSEWGVPRLVYPDIAEHPRFFLDESGAVVNGDCYWITLRPGVPREVLLLMLGIANSTFISRYYDTRFHNKLYAGRRRFMTQYVREFPLPDPDSPLAREIVAAADSIGGLSGSDLLVAEQHIDALVWRCFGLDRSRLEEVIGQA
jgi:predicted RNA methylase